MKYSIASRSDRGPRLLNEDSVGWWALDDGSVIAAIADGLGGMGGGSYASDTAINTLRRSLSFSNKTAEELMKSAQQAHLDILDAQKTSSEFKRMATTLTALLLSKESLAGIHCGDTRASIARGDGILRLTSDHSEAERLFQAGKLTKEEVRDYPRKNILYSALGADKFPKIDQFNFTVNRGDKIFLTTDGFHEKVLLREMRDLAEQHTRVQSFVNEVSELANFRNPIDNFSILAIFVS